jgi:hypothetical protein
MRQPRSTIRKILIAAMVLVPIGASLTGCGSQTALGPASKGFYASGESSQFPPGRIIHLQPLGVTVPGARSFRLLYQSSTWTALGSVEGSPLCPPTHLPGVAAWSWRGLTQ